MQPAPIQDLKRRLASLGRGAPMANSPVFAPMLFTVAAEIESLSAHEFVSDPTKMVRAGTELSRMLGLGTVYTGVPCGGVAQALEGVFPEDTCVTNKPEWGPSTISEPSLVWSQSALLSNFLAATRNMAADECNTMLPVLALEGPKVLASQLFGDTKMTDVQADSIGSALAVVVREFAEAGVSAIVMVDQWPGADEQEYARSAYRTLANVARFHRVPVVSVYSDNGSPTNVLPTVVPAFDPGATIHPTVKRYARLWPVTVGEWSKIAVDEKACFVTTAGEVPTDTRVEQLVQLANSSPALFS
tara:strand:- start:1266 stop:2171 length:906 start_codon:yes stop_codon:yes gene_type:complete